MIANQRKRPERECHHARHNHRRDIAKIEELKHGFNRSLRSPAKIVRSVEMIRSRMALQMQVTTSPDIHRPLAMEIQSAKAHKDPVEHHHTQQGRKGQVHWAKRFENKLKHAASFPWEPEGR